MQVDQWTHYPPTPPPINLLSIPYRLMRICLLPCRLRSADGSSGISHSSKSASKAGAFDMVSELLDDLDVEDLTETILDFSRDDDEANTAEQTEHLLNEVARVEERLTRLIMSQLAGSGHHPHVPDPAVDGAPDSAQESPYAAQYRALSALENMCVSPPSRGASQPERPKSAFKQVNWAGRVGPG